MVVNVVALLSLLWGGVSSGGPTVAGLGLSNLRI